MSHPNERQKQTETPRTDAACRQALINNPNRLTFADPIERMNGWQCMASSLECFARQLEMELNDISTELNAARAEVERLKDALLAIRDYDGPDRGGEYRIARDTLERIDSAMAEQPVNSSPEREPVANREQAEGGQE